ncbi:MAG: hypothetical protein LBQ15_11790 [Clostridium sp.]|jgi:hypothetical protein|nr:hypothetical protein [Clostridium sp.]
MVIKLDDQNRDIQNQAYPMETAGKPAGGTDVLAVVGLILGILSILACCLIIYLFPLLAGIAGLVCSIQSRKRGRSGLGTAALVCSIIGLVMNIGGLLFVLLGIGLLNAEWTQDLLRSLESTYGTNGF